MIHTGCLHKKREAEHDELGNSQLGLASIHEHWYVRLPSYHHGYQTFSHSIQTFHLVFEVYHVQSLYDLGFVGELTSSIFSESAVISNLMIKTILNIYITRKGGEGRGEEGEGRQEGVWEVLLQ